MQHLPAGGRALPYHLRNLVVAEREDVVEDERRALHRPETFEHDEEREVDGLHSVGSDFGAGLRRHRHCYRLR